MYKRQVVVFVLSARIHKMSVTTATIMLIVYSALNGATLSVIFVVYLSLIHISDQLERLGLYRLDRA